MGFHGDEESSGVPYQQWAMGIHHCLIISAKYGRDAHPFATGGPPANDTPEVRVGRTEELYSGYSGNSESANPRQVTVTGRDYIVLFSPPANMSSNSAQLEQNEYEQSLIFFTNESQRVACPCKSVFWGSRESTDISHRNERSGPRRTSRRIRVTRALCQSKMITTVHVAEYRPDHPNAQKISRPPTPCFPSMGSTRVPESDSCATKTLPEEVPTRCSSFNQLIEVRK